MPSWQGVVLLQNRGVPLTCFAAGCRGSAILRSALVLRVASVSSVAARAAHIVIGVRVARALAGDIGCSGSEGRGQRSEESGTCIVRASVPALLC